MADRKITRPEMIRRSKELFEALKHVETNDSNALHVSGPYSEKLLISLTDLYVLLRTRVGEFVHFR